MGRSSVPIANELARTARPLSRRRRLGRPGPPAIYEVARIPEGHKVGNFHIPLTLDGIARSTRAISTTPTCRTRARAGRSSRSGTIENLPAGTGFAIVSGDLHSFWAGYAAARLPPDHFEPVGLSFVGASLSSAGAMESMEHKLAKDSPLRPLYLADRPNGAKPDWTYNMLLRHGVRSCLEYAKTFDLERAPFVDMGGHGYATVRLSGDEMRTVFVSIPRPIARSERADGGPLRYRVAHTAKLWRPGERPRLTRQVLEGDPGLAI